ncbi:MAG: prohibitin family protein [Candidatus Lambdaproteobacteria bacterium]|nr:prohibitin family protein [Candidatus Lambdaproteobacteria bacterium]
MLEHLPKSIIFWTLGIVLAIPIALGSYFTVQEQERAVLLRFGEAQGVYGSGLHAKLPFMDTVYKVNISIQSLTDHKVNTYTVDNQEVSGDFTINFRIPASEVLRVYKEVPDYQQRLRTLASERFKRILGSYNTQELPKLRQEIALKVHDVVKAEAARLFGIEIVDFQFSNVDYTARYKTAVEAAAVAKQEVEQAEQQKKKALVDADQRKIAAIGEANAAREAARGAADAVLLKAEADAKATRLQGAAEASAIHARAEALKANPMLIELKKAEAWNGALPTTVGVGAAIPFIDVQSVKK